MITRSKDLRAGNPLWLGQPQPRLPFQPLKTDTTTDIVIIGAGITGAMAAESLSAAGFDVVMLDKRGPLKGATSASTALLQYEIDTPLTILSGQIGYERAMRAWRRSRLALEGLRARIASLDIRCSVERASSLYLAGNVLNAEELKDEAQLRNEVGLYVDYLTRDALREAYGLKRLAALKGYDNFPVNPVRLAAGLLKQACARGVRIYAPSTAEAVETHRVGIEVKTAEGPIVRAKTLIYASGYEMPKEVRTRRHSLHSTFAIATRPQPDRLWPGKSLIWEASDPYLYLRTTADGRIICGGEDEPFEDEDKRNALLVAKTRTLETKLKTLFPHVDAKADYAWCGSFGASTTGLPTIGPVPGRAHTYAVLAYGGNGITFSRIGAEMLTSQLQGRDDPEADLFAF